MIMENINQIYKIYKVDSTGTPITVYVFGGELVSPNELKNQVFSEIELAEFEVNKTEIIYSKQQLHKDDSIRIIKKKLIHEIGIDTISYDEIYLFSNITEKIQLLNVYQTITNNEKTPLDSNTFGQLLLNLNIDVDIINNIDVKDTYNYDDLIKYIDIDKNNTVKIPIGQKFISNNNLLFSANPFDIIPSTEPFYKTNPNNPKISFENNLLLSYGNGMFKDNKIYFCKTIDILDYAIENSIDEKYICEQYYPLLFNAGITNRVELLENQTRLLKENKKIVKPDTLKLYDTVDLFYNIYNTRTSELKYVDRGITSFHIVIHPEIKTQLPLDAIFKNIHATIQTPFIKYNAGPRKENIYRLYSEKISRNGKKIPYLSRNLIMNLSKQIGKSKQISLFTQTLIKNAMNNIFIDFEYNGNIVIRCDSKIPLSVDELESILVETVNPIINNLNTYLEQTGYSLDVFKGLSDNLLEIVSIKYFSSIIMDNAIDLNDFYGCLSSIFNIIDDDISKGAILEFKRVENYKKMDAISASITEWFDNGYNEMEIVDIIMNKYSLSFEDSSMQLAKYYNENTRIQGKFVNKSVDIVENAGFNTLFNILPFENKFTIEITNINHIGYVPILEIYLDSFLRMSQSPKSSGITIDVIKRTCKKGSKIIDIPHIENIIMPISESITFGSIINEEEEGFEFEEGEDFEEEGEDIKEQGEWFGFEDEEYYDEEEEGNNDTINEENDTKKEDDDTKKEENDTKKEVSGGKLGSLEKEEGASGETLGFPEKRKLFDNKPFKKNDLLFNKMKNKEQKLFLSRAEGNYESYSRVCPSNVNKQPIILDEKEKERIDKEFPGSYNKALKYGTNPDKPYYYICPRYWCLLTNSSMTQADVVAGKCGKIIPRFDENGKPTRKIPQGHYVYEFTDDKYHKDSKGDYREHYPGFLPSDSHPDGLCVPCCYNNWDNEARIKRRNQCSSEEGKKPETGTIQQNNLYIVGIDKYPVSQYRWGFLPPAVELFFHIDHSKHKNKDNAALINMDSSILLRYGVEQSTKQSFIGCIADVYAAKSGLNTIPTIKEMRKIIAESLILDNYIKYHNGSLVSTFQPKKIYVDELNVQKYSETEFYKNIDTTNEVQMDLLEDTIASFENFVNFLNDDNSIIDHTYLWDILVHNNKSLFTRGMNLVILEIINNDTTDNIHVLCPTNSYSKTFFDRSKETFILLKHDNFYEPIYLYENKSGHGLQVMKMFYQQETTIKNIKNVLQIIQNTTNNYCSPKSSILRKVYKFERNIPLLTLLGVLKENDYYVTSQVMNYQDKIIGLMVKNDKESKKQIFIPCYPSSAIDAKELKIEFMENDLWTDYKTTRNKLMNINKKTEGKVLCKPILKVLENNLVVGVLTETNQFIQVVPPSENIEDDGIEVLKSSNFLIADKVITTSKKEDEERTEITKKIFLESEFYLAFRSTIRILMNRYDNKELREKILKIIESNRYLYKEKLQKIDSVLKKMSTKHIQFEEFDKKLLDSIHEISTCLSNCNSEKKYCISNENEECSLKIPKNHLVSNVDNRAVYFARMADELLRYKRIRIFMFEPKTYLNISNVDYKLNDNEFIILQYLLTNEYFDELIPFQMNDYVNNITYEISYPDITQKYDNRVTLKEQNDYAGKALDSNELQAQCIEKTGSIYGNATNIWRKRFPKMKNNKEIKEIYFNNTNSCSFYIMIHILQLRLNTVLSISSLKQTLWLAYKPYMESYNIKIFDILEKQGKKDIIQKITKGFVTFETMIMSEEYYLTDLDIWVLCNKLKFPIILFSLDDFRTMITDVNWLVLAGDIDEQEFYFVRSPKGFKVNAPPYYSLIDTPLKLYELKGMDGIIENEVTGKGEYKNHFITFDTFIQGTYGSLVRTLP